MIVCSCANFQQRCLRRRRLFTAWLRRETRLECVDGRLRARARLLPAIFFFSAVKADKCGVCNGNGTTCKGHDGVIKETKLTNGYNDVLTLPVGATAIRIEENRPTSNSLGESQASFFPIVGARRPLHCAFCSPQSVDGDGGCVRRRRRCRRLLKAATSARASGERRLVLFIIAVRAASSRARLRGVRARASVRASDRAMR